MYVVSLFGTVLLMIYYYHVDLIPLFIVLSKFGISASFNMCFISFVQLIPTIFSTRLFGFCNTPARLATVFAPVIASRDYPTPLLFNIVAVSLAAVSSLLIVNDLPKFI